MQRDLIFQGLTNSAWFWFTTLCCIVAGGLIITLLKYERQLVSKPVGRFLMLLRLTVVVALFIAFLEPVSSWTLDKDKAGRIVVAVDLSESMNTADRFASKAELLRWARVLEMIGNRQTDAQLDEWIRAYEADKEPAWVTDTEATTDTKRQELSTFRKENVEQVLEQVRQLPRREIVKRLLTAGSHPLLDQLAKIGTVELKLFGGQVEPIDATVFKDLAAPPGNIATKQSDLAIALDVFSADTTTQVIGAVLISDGRHNTDRDPVPVAARLGSVSVPVFPLMIGSERRPRDIAIVTVDAPQTAFKNDSPVVRTKISADGYENQELAITLEKSNGEPETKTIRVPAGSQHATLDVEFTLKANELGRHNYTIRTNARPDETRDDNNQRSFSLQVVDDKARVFLAENEARWEFRFINNAYARDERIELKQVVFEQPFLKLLPETFFPRTLNNALPPQAGLGLFNNLDLVVVGDVSPTQFNDAVWDQLENFVRNDGGTLVIMAGKNNFPKNHKSPALGRMIPMKDLRIVDLTTSTAEQPPAERGFRLKLTPDGEKHTMFQFDTDVVDNRNIWNQLPGHTWGILGEARPGTSVLAMAKPNEQPDLADERRNAVVVHQFYGFGQVLWLGIDSTWRWRHRVGDQYHHRFWGQLARWAAENKASAGNSFVRLNLRENPVPSGQDAFLTARWEPRFQQQNPNLKAFIEVYAETDAAMARPIARQPLLTAEGRAGFSEGRVGGLLSGSYKLKLVTEGADLGPEPVTTMLYVQEPTTGELSDLSANRDLLSKIAAAGQGQLVMPDEIQRIPDLIQPPDRRNQSREERTLWDHWLTMLIFFALLTTEWVVRKLNGLP